MKKYIGYLLLMLFVPVLFFTGCSNSEPTTITLSKENYSEYIGFNITYGDIYQEDNMLFCIANVSTFAKKNNIVFDSCNIQIKLSYSIADGWIANNQENTIDTCISVEGKSQSSICLIKYLTPNEDFFTPTSRQSNIILESITGQVIVK